jgi:acyl-CoA synthetase (AMP-forming)/AMP-acid ligase II/thioesterase domain-containing protein
MIRRLVTQAAEAAPNAIAVLAPGCDALSYDRLDQVVTRVGRALARSGIGRGDRVGLVCSNGPHMATSFLSITSRAACAPLNPGYRASEFEFYLEDLRPRAVVIEAGLDSAVRDVAAARHIPVFELVRAPLAPAGDIDISGPALGDAGDPSPPDEGDVALLLHTSGTTSRPKLVPLTHANLYASACHIARSLGLTPDDRVLNVMPLFHIHGLVASVLASLSRGASVVCCPGFVAPKFFDWIEAFRPTWYTAVPTIHQAVLARLESHRDIVATHRLRFIRSCSSALAPSLMHEMEAAFRVPVIEAYGMTEASHQMASNPLPPGAHKPGSVGVAAGPEIAVMDDAGELLASGTEGEVVIRGPNVTPGYVANPDANRAAFTNGWFRTGDKGYLDPDGYLFLSGRRKEIINRGGEKIAPREIDEVLLTHPDIGQAVAFAVPHARLGETVAAAVVLKPGRTPAERDLRAFAAERLADFKVPERILFLDEIPKGPSGKIQRIGLAARLGVDAIPPAAAAPAPFVAPRSRIEQEVAAAFADTLGIERAGLHDHFFDHGGDSLLAEALLVRIRAVAGAELPMLTFLEDPTVAGVCANIPRAGFDRPERPGGALRYIVKPGPGRPLFCFPGSSNDILGFFRLARRLGHDQPVIAFRFPATISALEELASRYVREVLDAQPDGAYRLVGLCAGGFVAYEVARQLSAGGRTVDLLAVLDCYNHDWGARLTRPARAGYRIDLLRRRASYQWSALRKAGVGGAVGHLRGRLGAFAETFRQRAHERTIGWTGRAGRRAFPASDPATAIRKAAARYAPGVFAGRLDLFRAEEPRVDGYAYPDMGWQGLARHGIAVHDVPGGHQTLLAEPSLQVIAGRLLERLMSAAGDPSRAAPPGRIPLPRSLPGSSR